MKKYMLIAIIVILVFIGIWAVNAYAPKPSGAQPCTAEAMQCPDGSYVGRTGPNCEFAACPPATTTPPVTTSATTTLSIGESATVNGTVISVLSLAEDSRCPVDVQCIQAGTVRVNISVNSSGAVAFTLGQPQVVGGKTITFASVVPPQKNSKQTLQPADYRFTFTVFPKPVTVPAPLTITSDDENTTVHLKNGAEFKVALGGGLNWGNISFAPASAITFVSGPNAADSSQGVYKAVQAGTITLSATGGPICKPGEACPDYFRSFMVTLVITN